MKKKKKANIADLRNSLPKIIKEVEEGTSYVVMRNNIPVAKIVPLKSNSANIQKEDSTSKQKFPKIKKMLPSISSKHKTQIQLFKNNTSKITTGESSQNEKKSNEEEYFKSLEEYKKKYNRYFTK